VYPARDRKKRLVFLGIGEAADLPARGVSERVIAYHSTIGDRSKIFW
jgi:hypothetical protein